MTEEPFLESSRVLSKTCRYDKAWQGACGKIANESGICEEHQIQKCSVCGAQATHECNYCGQFVCGAPLCDNCEEGEAGDSSKGLGWGFIGHTHRRRIPTTVEGAMI